MDKRLMKLLSTRGKEIRGGQMLDTYNQQIQEDVSCTIRTNINTANHHFVVEEPQVLTPKRTEFGKAVRKQYENKELKMSRHTMQQLEPRKDGVTNTLTSVQKDNLVAEPLSSVHPISHKQEIEKGAGIKPIVPALRATDHKAPHCVYIPEATAQGYAEAYEGDSVNLAVPNSKTRRGRVDKQMANTLDCGCQQGVVVSEEWKSIVGNKQMNPFRGSVENESPCITSACGAGGGMTPMLTDADLETTKTKDFIEQVRGHKEMRYRIRKLTPRECFRLMGVDDKDIDTIQGAGISNTQMYKLAGNSIVIDTLYHQFRKAFCETENEQQQMTLF